MAFNEYEKEMANDLGGPLPIKLVDKDNSSLAAAVDSDGHLKVDIITGGGAGEQYADGNADNGTEKGNIALGSDGSNFRYLLTDNLGKLQVDVIGGGGTSGQLVEDAEAVNAGDVARIIAGSDGSNYQHIIVDSDGHLQIDALTLPNVTLASQVNPFTNDINISLDGEQVDVSDRAARDLGKVDIAGFDVSLPAGTNNIGDIDVVSSALPTGAATEATLATLLTEATFAAEDFATQTTLAALLTELQGKADLTETQPVDVVDRAARDLGKVDIAAFDVSLPTGTNSIGEVTQDTHDSFNANVNLQISDVDVDNSNPVPISIQPSGITSQVSSGNSTTTPLGSSATFTGAWESALGAAQISIVIFSNQNSALDGLVVEWSSDGTNVDEDDKFTVFANNGKQFTFGPPSQYFRVRYTNGTSAQSTFRMQTVLHPFAGKPSSHRLIDNLNDNDDAELVKAIIAAKDPNDLYINLTSDSSGRLSVSTQPPTPPENTTPVVTVADGLMNANTTVDSFYTITNGTDLVIQRFNAGAVQTTGGNVVELYYDPNGSTPTPPALGSGWVLISVAFIPDSGGNYTEDLSPVVYEGDGTARIVLRRTHLSGNNLRVFSKFSGFEAS